MSQVETVQPVLRQGDVVVRLEDVYRIYRMGTEEVYALNGVSVEFRVGSFWATRNPRRRPWSIAGAATRTCN